MNKMQRKQRGKQCENIKCCPTTKTFNRVLGKENRSKQKVTRKALGLSCYISLRGSPNVRIVWECMCVIFRCNCNARWNIHIFKMYTFMFGFKCIFLTQFFFLRAPSFLGFFSTRAGNKKKSHRTSDLSQTPVANDYQRFSVVER